MKYGGKNLPFPEIYAYFYFEIKIFEVVKFK